MSILYSTAYSGGGGRDTRHSPILHGFLLDKYPNLGQTPNLEIPMIVLSQTTLIQAAA